jgi:hypothetical protein
MSSLSAGRGKIVVESDSLSVKSSMSVAYSDICNAVEKLDFNTVLKSSMRSEHGVDGDMPASCSADTIRQAVLYFVCLFLLIGMHTCQNLIYSNP